MKIDLHCHTRKIKFGDALTREVSSSKFSKVINENEVKIVAITNHNKFDLEQYNDFLKVAKGNFQLWPGIELDIRTNANSKGHLIIVSNPKEVDLFAQSCNRLLEGMNVDKDMILIDNIIEEFKDKDIIMLAHYLNKNPVLTESEIKLLEDKMTGIPIYREPQNLKSAGIMYAHGLDCFVGSDVHDWDDYPGESLPELKLPVQSFEKFKLLIRKDKEVIDTFVNLKKREGINVHVGGDSYDIPLYNDVNVIFGGKGTGKSEILKSIYSQVAAKSSNKVSYYDGNTKEKEFDKLLNSEITIDTFSELNTDSLSEEFEKLKNYQISEPTLMSDYLNWHNTQGSANALRNFKIKESTFSEIINLNLIEDFKNDAKETNQSEEKLNSLIHYSVYFDKDLSEIQKVLFSKLNEKIRASLVQEWKNSKAQELVKFSIDKFKVISTNKSGEFQKPSGTGLIELYNSISKTIVSLKKISLQLNSHSYERKQYIGTLQEKGDIYAKQIISLNPKVTETKVISGKNITSLRKVSKQIDKCLDEKYTINYSMELSNLVTLLNEYEIDSLKDFMNFKTAIVKEDDSQYSPSSGEKSMLMVNNALVSDKFEYYILDEPELSIGHNYINDVIINRLKVLSSLNKVIIISTHDANIATRTLPFNSIYREYVDDHYKTYVGNLFSDCLVDIYNDNNKIKWTDTTVNFLEGGDVAFRERRDIYGD